MRNLLLLFVALAVGVIAVLAADPGSGTGVEAVQGDGTVPREPTEPALGVERGAPPEPEEGRVAASRASLDVRVVGPRGGPIDASIELDHDDGRRTATGNQRFDGLVPGRYTLRVTHAEFPAWERAIELSPDEAARQVVQLRTDLVVNGTVIDRFGEKRVGERVWFLGPGQRHPLDGRIAAEVLSAVSDRSGKLRATLPDGGPWTVSVGHYGRPRVQGEEIELTHGGPTQLEVVLPDATLLEVRAKRETPSAVTVLVLQRREHDERGGSGMPGGANPGEDDDDRARAARLEAARNRQGGSGDAPGRVEELAPPPPAPSDWTVRFSGRLPNDGVLRIPDLAAGQEFRIGLQTGDGRYESDSTVTLAPDQKVVVELDVPRARPEEADAAPTLPLAVRSRVEPLSAHERPAGVRWVK